MNGRNLRAAPREGRDLICSVTQNAKGGGRAAKELRESLEYWTSGRVGYLEVGPANDGPDSVEGRPETVLQRETGQISTVRWCKTAPVSFCSSVVWFQANLEPPAVAASGLITCQTPPFVGFGANPK